MDNSGRPNPPAVPEPWRPKFGLGMMLLVMLVCSVIAAAGSYFWRASVAGAPVSSQLIFVIFTLAAPMVLLVIVSGVMQIVSWLGRSGRR